MPEVKTINKIKKKMQKRLQNGITENIEPIGTVHPSCLPERDSIFTRPRVFMSLKISPKQTALHRPYKNGMHFLLAFVIFYITLLNVNGAFQHDLTAAERSMPQQVGRL